MARTFQVISNKKIDIGCGEKPYEGYDVYTDVYQPTNLIKDKFILCSMEDMPFNDGDFAYSRCHHVIEHVSNPDCACKELIRVSKRGTLWFPTPQAELLFGRGDHRWFVFVEDNRLLFIARRFRPYGIKLACKKSVEFSWEGTFEWEVVR